MGVGEVGGVKVWVLGQSLGHLVVHLLSEGGAQLSMPLHERHHLCRGGGGGGTTCTQYAHDTKMLYVYILYMTLYQMHYRCTYICIYSHAHHAQTQSCIYMYVCIIILCTLFGFADGFGSSGLQAARHCATEELWSCHRLALRHVQLGGGGGERERERRLDSAIAVSVYKTHLLHLPFLRGHP